MKKFQTAEWWCQNNDELVLFSEKCLIRDHITAVETVDGLDGALLVTGKKYRYFLYRDDYLDPIEVKHWYLRAASELPNIAAEEAVLKEVQDHHGWAWKKGSPKMVIDGNRMTTMGAAIPIHTDIIRAIAVFGQNYIAVSERHKYLLFGEAN